MNGQCRDCWDRSRHDLTEYRIRHLAEHGWGLHGTDKLILMTFGELTQEEG